MQPVGSPVAGAIDETPMTMQQMADGYGGGVCSRGLADLLSEPTWRSALSEEFSKPYFRELHRFVQSEMSTQRVFPPRELIWQAFNRCPFERVKVCLSLRC